MDHSQGRSSLKLSKIGLVALLFGTEHLKEELGLIVNQCQYNVTCGSIVSLCLGQ